MKSSRLLRSEIVRFSGSNKHPAHSTNLEFVGAFILQRGIVPTTKWFSFFCARIPRLKSWALCDEK